MQSQLSERGRSCGTLSVLNKACLTGFRLISLAFPAPRGLISVAVCHAFALRQSTSRGASAARPAGSTTPFLSRADPCSPPDGSFVAQPTAPRAVLRQASQIITHYANAERHHRPVRDHHGEAGRTARVTSLTVRVALARLTATTGRPLCSVARGVFADPRTLCGVICRLRPESSQPLGSNVRNKRIPRSEKCPPSSVRFFQACSS